MVDDRPEALRRLEEQLDRASQAAERLAEEAGRATGSAERPTSSGHQATSSGERPKPPPAGWQSPSGQEPSPTLGAELDALLSAIRAVRELIPPEVLHRLADAVKEVLLAIRALIDYYLERLDRHPPESPKVEDIPIR